MEPTAKPLPQDCAVGIGKGIILSILTCGLYNIYWNYLQFRAMNELLRRHEYDFVKWLLLSIVTCGIYHVYYEYKMGTDLHAYMTANGHAVNPNLAVIGLVLSIFGLTIIADAIYQSELNRLVP